MGWLIPSEVQPLETRSVGQSLATAVNFLVAPSSLYPGALSGPRAWKSAQGLIIRYITIALQRSGTSGLSGNCEEA